MTPRNAYRSYGAVRIVVVGDLSESSVTGQLSPYLDRRAAELVVLDEFGNGLPAITDHDADFLLLDVTSEEALSALDQVKTALRHHDDPPTVVLARLDRAGETIGEFLGCAASRLRGGKRERSPSLDDITPRQREILRMVARSHTSREIGEKLEISPRTVETHRANMMQRLGIHDVAGLVRFAVAEGLVEPEF